MTKNEYLKLMELVDLRKQYLNLTPENKVIARNSLPKDILSFFDLFDQIESKKAKGCR